MKQQRVVVALFGTGFAAEYLAVRIRARTDLQLVTVAVDAELPAGVDCVVYLPRNGELLDGSAAARITAWLRAGCNVVSTAPVEAFPGVDLLAACRDGKSTFHGTGGYPTRLVSRFNRAFASITRNIRDVELIEERDVAELPADDGHALESFYAAGLHTLADAVFGDPLSNEILKSDVSRPSGTDALSSRIGKSAGNIEQLVARRTLGKHVAYDTVWRRREGSDVPLRYRLNSQSSDAIGHVTIEFHSGGGVDPADHLACGAVLDAIRPVCESRPGILRHELGINHVWLNDCLAG